MEKSQVVSYFLFVLFLLSQSNIFINEIASHFETNFFIVAYFMQIFDWLTIVVYILLNNAVLIFEEKVKNVQQQILSPPLLIFHEFQSKDLNFNSNCFMDSSFYIWQFLFLFFSLISFDFFPSISFCTFSLPFYFYETLLCLFCSKTSQQSCCLHQNHLISHVRSLCN